ncbi:hypothetical protein EMGBS15_08600 [Filimonas sp.]|nr:hypothetical protein EMGBS15_08600 [Filimonas sp.]
MKRNYLFTLLVLFQILSFTAFAQGRADKVESIKVAYLSEKLNLDPKTAERFWPVYNQYDDEMHKVLQESRKANDSRSAEEILDQEQKAIDIKRKYSVLFQKVISGEQLTKLFQSEKEFNRILLRRMNKMEQKKQNMEQDNQEPRFRDRPGMNRRNPEAMENLSRPSSNQPEERVQRRANR